jgi:hypothetical protein
MSTIYDAEAAINKAISDRAKLPAMIDAAMAEHKRTPTAQGALSLARTVSGYILISGVTDDSGRVLLNNLLTEAAMLGASSAEVMNVAQSVLDSMRKMSEGLDAAMGPEKTAN